ncbi:MAG: hypothetical protein A4E68_01732 [Syntrophaceae bacterium PtaB.Bin095]|nr:MAG: hypothetical protein A4E68_01732 [Syntrophaceae bacterium PtaB.Bin095]
MKTARRAPVVAHPRVIRLDAHRPPYTADQLIQEARCNYTDHVPDVFDPIRDLPETLPAILDLMLADFDYRASLTSRTAVGCRLLAAVSARFIDIFDTIRKEG